MISGVALGLAEYYGVPVSVVRWLFITGFFASPLVALLYLLLAISIPDEERVAARLQYTADTDKPPSERFETFGNILLSRLIRRRPAISPNLVAIVLLVFAAVLELPRAEGSAFYLMHPFVTWIDTSLSRIASIVFYCTLALFFIIPRRGPSTVVLTQEPRDRFVPERSSRKSIAGIFAGISSAIEIEPAYLRVLFILLNFFTIGITGVLYLVVWYAYRGKERVSEATPVSATSREASNGRRLQVMLSISFLLLAVFRLSTEFRLFFFNEPVLQGILFAAIGTAWVSNAFSSGRSKASMAVLAGSSIFFYGIYLIASAAGRVQLSVEQRIMVFEIIVAIAFLYFALMAVKQNVRRIALFLMAFCGVAAAMVAFDLTPPRYLSAILRFYDFFYPIVFAALGLWTAFEQ